MNEGFKFDHMKRLLENLVQNPSNRAVNEAYTFLENYGLPITDDGCFLAYKAVRRDYKDIYSGTIDNSIGASPTMPRFQVDETYEKDCSSGLHVGALEYVLTYGHFQKGHMVNSNGNRLLIVKVDPRDVVSVPKYKSHPKMRVSKYTVVDEIKDVVKELDKVVYTASAKEFQPDMNDAAVPPSDESFNTAKYEAGKTCGRSDYDSGLLYGESLTKNYSQEFRDGYHDGYNEDGTD
jgi:hypothetical protein